MRRGRLVAAGAALGLVAVAASAPASMGTGGRTMHLTATTARGYPLLVDVVGDADATPAEQERGDSVILLNGLSGSGAGRGSVSAGQFTLVAPASGLRLASVVLELAGGQVALSGFVRLAAEQNTIAVTGGTGRYSGVEGHMTFDRKQGRVNHYTLVLRG